MSSHIYRSTLFKVPSPVDQQRLIEAYRVLERDHQKGDGKPYILSMKTGTTMRDQRSRGWTVVSQAEFASVEDMRYYDEECKAHAELRETLNALGLTVGTRRIMVVSFSADPVTFDRDRIL
ncbi:hypothetical protein ANO14919_128680 [Xylariales sp. No.14919]|nr:hypothetical protein ANO14919_128680 [Xylariales sp. No.14919]